MQISVIVQESGFLQNMADKDNLSLRPLVISCQRPFQKSGLLGLTIQPLVILVDKIIQHLCHRPFQKSGFLGQTMKPTR